MCQLSCHRRNYVRSTTIIQRLQVLAQHSHQPHLILPTSIPQTSSSHTSARIKWNSRHSFQIFTHKQNVPIRKYRHLKKIIHIKTCECISIYLLWTININEVVKLIKISTIGHIIIHINTLILRLGTSAYYQLDLVILEVFSYLNYSVLLCTIFQPGSAKADVS